MIANERLDLKSVKIHKVIPSLRVDGKTFKAQVTFLLDEEITKKVVVQRSQTFHVRLESDGNYH